MEPIKWQKFDSDNNLIYEREVTESSGEIAVVRTGLFSKGNTIDVKYLEIKYECQDYYYCSDGVFITEVSKILLGGYIKLVNAQSKKLLEDKIKEVEELKNLAAKKENSIIYDTKEI